MILKKLMTVLSVAILIFILFAGSERVDAASAVKLWAPDWVNERVEYAYSISNGNMRFIWTIDAENSQWTYDRRSNTWYYRGGKKYYDWGICQISEYYHKGITSDVRFWTDWKWQMDQCWRLYKGGTKFYWSKNSTRQLKQFKVIK